MTTLILAGGGFIGGRVGPWLEKQGEEAIAASRSGVAPASLSLDRRDPGAVRQAVREHRITTVVDVWAMTEPDTAPLLDVLDGEVGRYVLISSADVYGNYDGLLRRPEAAAPVPGPLGEEAPLRRSRYPYRPPERLPADDPRAWLNDYDKILVEDAVRARLGLDGVILRLPMVYGPGDAQRRFAWICGPLARGDEVVEAAPAQLDWVVTHGYVEDVASAIAAAALHPAAGGRTFNLGEPASVPGRVWAERFARAAGRDIEVRPSEVPASGLLAALDLSYPFVFDTTALRETLGWSEPTPLEEAVRATWEDERARG